MVGKDSRGGCLPGGWLRVRYLREVGREEGDCVLESKREQGEGLVEWSGVESNWDMTADNLFSLGNTEIGLVRSDYSRQQQRVASSDLTLKSFNFCCSEPTS
ncbi:hypothetical protein Pcinc_011607 [Petrolisthes cinctipes]|uniref:Uncharacterized protein n=1 Tax=Petrolisthes cinctipes TaxID=88211 RepID=A0AAE1KTA4_PETCI|nr:hypothetical protein Pcinc_011607 [Petrolisthes cinctipes]